MLHGVSDAREWKIKKYFVLRIEVSSCLAIYNACAIQSYLCASWITIASLPSTQSLYPPTGQHRCLASRLGFNCRSHFCFIFVELVALNVWVSSKFCVGILYMCLRMILIDDRTFLVLFRAKWSHPTRINLHKYEASHACEGIEAWHQVNVKSFNRNRYISKAVTLTPMELSKPRRTVWELKGQRHRWWAWKCQRAQYHQNNDSVIKPEDRMWSHSK